MGKFLVDRKDPFRQHIDPHELSNRYNEYQEYLRSVQGSMPKDAYAFASASWHLDPNDHRCPHDATPDKVEILYLPSYKAASPWKKKVDRHGEIRLRLLGPYWDGFIKIRYKDIYDYDLAANADWLYDEIRMTKDGYVFQEIVFASKKVSWIKCKDIKCTWHPFKKKAAAKK